MNEKDYTATIAVLDSQMDSICKKINSLINKLEECPVYRSRVNTNMVSIKELTQDMRRISDVVHNIKGKFYAVSILIGLGSSVISGSIVYVITRMILGG